MQPRFAYNRASHGFDVSFRAFPRLLFFCTSVHVSPVRVRPATLHPTNVSASGCQSFIFIDLLKSYRWLRATPALVLALWYSYCYLSPLLRYTDSFQFRSSVKINHICDAVHFFASSFSRSMGLLKLYVVTRHTRCGEKVGTECF